MPISFLVDQRSHVVHTTIVGAVGLVDLSLYVRSLAERDLLSFRQLIDGRQGTLLLSPEDTVIFAELMAALRAKHGRAAVAFVPGDELSHRVADQYRELGAGMNPRFATFTDIDAAESWLAMEVTR